MKTSHRTMGNSTKLVFHLENPNYTTNFHKVYDDTSQRAWQNTDKKHAAAVTQVTKSEITTGKKVKVVKIPPATNQMSLWKRYCSSSTVHGLRYIADDELNFRERLIWGTLVCIAAFGILYFSYLLQIRFSSNRKATVVESTIFPISEISYPAVTVCNFNRINAEYVDDAIKYFLPNSSSEYTKMKLKNFIEDLNYIEIGLFSEMNSIINKLNISLSDINHINVTELYEKVTQRCVDLFKDGTCWWSNRFYNCCTLMTQQKSEFGLCYSFNSGTNDEGLNRLANDIAYPLRTSNAGDWSGIRFQMKVDTRQQISTANKSASGLKIAIHHPLQWPSHAYFIPAGTITSVTIKPTYSYATSDVSRLSPEERECVYPEDIYYPGSIYKTLPTTKYTGTNCVSECRNLHIMKLCNCSLYLFYPEINSGYPSCNIEDFRCLSKFDDVLSYIKPVSNEYFDPDEKGIICNCLPECTRINYELEVSPIRFSAGTLVDTIYIDIHFQQGTMVKYRTYIVFDWMDLLVAFGGIAGLFLGISLLSLAEIGFFILMGLIETLHNGKEMIYNLRKTKKLKKAKVQC